MPIIPAVFGDTDYLTVFEIAKSTLIIIRRPQGEDRKYFGHIVRFCHKQEISIYVTKSTSSSVNEACAHALDLIEIAREFVKQERERKD